MTRRRTQVAEGTALEMRQVVNTAHGFNSHRLRHKPTVILIKFGELENVNE